MVDFINDDHKEMHEVLLQNGFTFEQNSKWHPQGSNWVFVYKNNNLGVSLFFDKYDYCVYARNIFFAEIHEAPTFAPLHQKAFKEVTTYFTQKESQIEGASTAELGSKEKPTESHPIEVITPELLAANGWTKEDFGCWTKEGFTLQALKHGYFSARYSIDVQCGTNNIDALQGFLKGYGLELRQLTSVDILKSEGFKEVGYNGLLWRSFIGGDINIEPHALDDNTVLIRHNQGDNSLVAPKDNPAKILQAVKFLEEFA